MAAAVLPLHHPLLLLHQVGPPPGIAVPDQFNSLNVTSHAFQDLDFV